MVGRKFAIDLWESTVRGRDIWKRCDQTVLGHDWKGEGEERERGERAEPPAAAAS